MQSARNGRCGVRLNKIWAAVVSLALPLLLSAFAGHATPAAECQPGQVAFETDGGVVRFKVEVADTSAERALGLMYRKSMPANGGMLFVYEQAQPVSFWMRNTLIPLDMIFMDESGTIRHIYQGARPLDETPIPGALPGDPDPSRQYVLEVNAGVAAKSGLDTGQPMASADLDQTTAVWPCRQGFPYRS